MKKIKKKYHLKKNIKNILIIFIILLLFTTYILYLYNRYKDIENNKIIIVDQTEQAERK